MTDVAVSSSTRTTDRRAWLDHARGIGIILVVYAHQMRAQTGAFSLPESWHQSAQDFVIYAFHMPLFFFLSGIVSVRSLKSEHVMFLMRDKIINIAYPYVLWSMISWISASLAQQYVNNKTDIGIFEIFYKPILQYWFLYVLFFCHVIAILLKRNFAIIYAVAAACVVLPIPFYGSSLNQFIYSFPFFALGLALSALSVDARPTTNMAAVQAVAMALLFFVLMSNSLKPLMGGGLIMYTRAIAGMLLVVAISRLIGERMAWLSAIGRASMAIYVTHTIVAAALRTVLRVSGVDDPVVMLLVCVVGGIILPIAVYRVAIRFGVEQWAGLGRAPKMRSTPARPAMV
jgi:fucose 4-O-acetylase-like acetyltransferase